MFNKIVNSPIGAALFTLAMCYFSREAMSTMTSFDYQMVCLKYYLGALIGMSAIKYLSS